MTPESSSYNRNDISLPIQILPKETETIQYWLQPGLSNLPLHASKGCCTLLGVISRLGCTLLSQHITTTTLSGKWTTHLPQHRIHTFQPCSLQSLIAYKTRCREEIILARLRVWHTLLTHSHNSKCEFCQIRLTLHHALLSTALRNN